MRFKRYRIWTILIWILILTFNLFFVLVNPSLFGWFAVGFVAGGLVIMLLDNILLFHMDRYINFLNTLSKELTRRYEYYLKKYTNLKKKRKKK